MTIKIFPLIGASLLGISVPGNNDIQADVAGTLWNNSQQIAYANADNFSTTEETDGDCLECTGEDMADYNDVKNGYPAYNVEKTECLVSVPAHLLGNKAKKYNTKPKIKPEVLENFTEMHNAAKQDGINLLIYYGYRSEEDQKKIVRIMKNSGRGHLVAPVGHTEHHTGCAIDIEGASEGSTKYNWLIKNAKKYGFDLSYPKNNSQDVPSESWHWRYNNNLQENPTW